MHGCTLRTENHMFYLDLDISGYIIDQYIHFIDILSALKSFENTVKA